jgi:hypothetical protein
VIDAVLGAEVLGKQGAASTCTTIFNGRLKGSPSRASVELVFDNSLSGSAALGGLTPRSA